MKATKVLIWYDHESDFLEVTWDTGSGSVEPAPDDDRVMEKLDADGNILGFSIMGVTELSGPAIDVELGGHPRSRLIGAEEAAEELGISPGRVHQLLREGRVEGAHKISRDWIVPSPVKVKPGTRGPVGVAGRYTKS